MADRVLARPIIPKLGILLTSMCQVKAFEAHYPQAASVDDLMKDIRG